jgi:microcystin-dependent protein
MFDTYMGVIQALGSQSAPENWGYCAGATLVIAQYTALYSLLGQRFGGSGQVTFGLPDLRGRAAMGQFQGPMTNDWVIGQAPGVEQSVLDDDQLPAHTHIHTYGGSGGGGGNDVTVDVAAVAGKNATATTGDYLAAVATATGSINTRGFIAPADIPAGETAMIGGVSGGGGGGQFDNSLFTIGSSGGSTSCTRMQPVTVVNFCICMDGLYPSRS